MFLLSSGSAKQVFLKMATAAGCKYFIFLIFGYPVQKWERKFIWYQGHFPDLINQVTVNKGFNAPRMWTTRILQMWFVHVHQTKRGLRTVNAATDNTLPGSFRLKECSALKSEMQIFSLTEAGRDPVGRGDSVDTKWWRLMSTSTGRGVHNTHLFLYS